MNDLILSINCKYEIRRKIYSILPQICLKIYAKKLIEQNQCLLFAHRIFHVVAFLCVFFFFSLRRIFMFLQKAFKGLIKSRQNEYFRVCSFYSKQNFKHLNILMIFFIFYDYLHSSKKNQSVIAYFISFEIIIKKDFETHMALVL